MDIDDLPPELDDFSDVVDKMQKNSKNLGP